MMEYVAYFPRTFPDDLKLKCRCILAMELLKDNFYNTMQVQDNDIFREMYQKLRTEECLKITDEQLKNYKNDLNKKIKNKGVKNSDVFENNINRLICSIDL